MEGLRECPHCGFDAVDFESPTNGLGWHAGCKACSASVLGFTQENAVHRWNTRATDPLLEEMAVALELSLLLVEMSTSYRSKDIAEQCKQALQKYREATCKQDAL
jgi:hypothetical protein